MKHIILTGLLFTALNTFSQSAGIDTITNISFKVFSNDESKPLFLGESKTGIDNTNPINTSPSPRKQVKKNLHLGFNFTAESTDTDNGGVAGFGIVTDYQLTRHSGFETGLYYRGYKNQVTVRLPSSGLAGVTIAERHLSVPVLYKFYSKVVNVSAGGTFDFFIGWKQKGANSGVIIDGYTIDPEFNIGVMGKISKTINLSEKLVLEPEVRVNSLSTNDRSYLGIGIAVKYRFVEKNTTGK